MSAAPKAKIISRTPIKVIKADAKAAPAAAKAPAKAAAKEKEENSWESGPDPATFSMPENSPFRDDVDLKMHGQEVKMAPSDNVKK